MRVGGGNPLTPDENSQVPEWAWQPYQATPEQLARHMADYLQNGENGPLQIQRLDGVHPQDEVRQMAEDLQRMRGLARERGNDWTWRSLKEDTEDPLRDSLDTRLRLMADRVQAISRLPDAHSVAGPLLQARHGLQRAGESLRSCDNEGFLETADQAAGHLTLTVPDRGPGTGNPHLWHQNQAAAGKVLLEQVGDAYAHGREPFSLLRHLRDLLDSLTRGPNRQPDGRDLAR